jgi:tRNA 5-methylaminomethyl-2-thiouridine biosynthesis bifunctional protein
LSRQHAPLADFALASYVFAHRVYRALFAAGVLREGIDGALCGSFQQAVDEEELAMLATLATDIPQVAEILDADAANARLGIEQQRGGYWFPLSGWLNPPAVCTGLLAHENIDVITGTGAVTLRRARDDWQAVSGGEVIAGAHCAVVATGVSTRAMAGLDWLPLRSIRGQTTELPASPALQPLRAAFCHDGYVAPARGGWHTIGATFDIEDSDTALRAGDHGHNVAALGEAVPAWRAELEKVPLSELGGRVGFRCASPDYLPLAGPVPDRAAFQTTFAPLAANARRVVEERGDYRPGLYLTTGHGSRGLTSTPLAAELIASMICAEPLPLERELVRALAPARFLIRELVRGRRAP